MKKLILMLIMIPVFGTVHLYAQNLSENGAFDVLTKWEGKWKNKAIFEKSLWNLERSETRGTTESGLILSNNYLETMVYNGDSSSKYIIVYDQSSNQFNRWEFSSDGNNTFWTGKWKKSENSMTWNYIDFSNSGINGKIIESFKSDEMIETSVTMKDSSGNILLRINSTKAKN